LPTDYLESHAYKIRGKNVIEDPEIESNQAESISDEPPRTLIADNMDTDTVLSADDKPDLQNVDYAKLTSDDSDTRRQQLDNIAEAALEFQPRGFTLETTEVITPQ
jgi:hypothetical protein